MELPVAEFNAFHGMGIALGAWAVIVSVIGFVSASFPRNDGGARAVMGITVLLVAGTIGAAIATSEKHTPEGTERGDRDNPTHEGEPAENTPREEP